MRQKIINAIRLYIKSKGDWAKVLDILDVSTEQIEDALQREEARNARQSKRMLEYYRTQKHD